MSISNKTAAVICLSLVFLFAVPASAESYGEYPAGSASAGPFLVIFILAVLALVVLQLAAMYKVFERAGKPGWTAIVPIYNTWVLAELVGKPGWFGIVAAVPLFGLAFWIIIHLDISKYFGKGTSFGIGLAFLPFIFFPIMAFSRDTGSPQYATGPSSVQLISEETTPAQQQQPVNV